MRLASLLNVAWVLSGVASVATAGEAGVPSRLSDTGLFAPGTSDISAEVLSFTPQYPLWSDGATKRRWIYLPPGSSIDVSQPDEWQFPPGTRLWKEFSHGRPVETRMIERLEDGSWRFLVYLWNADGSEATLAPAEGIAGLPVVTAPTGSYDIPSREDCAVCHTGGQVPVLGFSALQLSPDRDPLAPHAEPVRTGDTDLRHLIATGRLRNAPPELLEVPPRISASSPEERASLGYLHANCGHCHNGHGSLALLELVLSQDVRSERPNGTNAIHTTVGRASDSKVLGLDTRIVPGRPDTSLLAARMRSRSPMTQMPPLGSHVVDAEGVGLVEQWIRQLARPN